MSNGFSEKLIKIKYDIPNDKPELFEQYSRQMAEWYSSAASEVV